MNRIFRISINYNNNLSFRNEYNTKNDYSCGCFFINNPNINEIAKTN